MSSWVFETYKNGNVFGEYRWNKGNTYEVNFGHITTKGFAITDIFHGIYSNVESAKRAFKRQVRKLQ